MSLRAELQRIYDDRGVLSPAVLVEVASDEEHPLHDKFEWDDETAGHHYRLIQAGRMIRSVKVRYTSATSGDTYSVRAWHSVKEDDGSRSYDPVREVARDPLLVKIALADMERDWRTLRARWERYGEFWDLVAKATEDRKAIE